MLRRAIATASSEVLPPSGTTQPPPGHAAPCQRDRQRGSHAEAGALGGVTGGQVDDGLRPPQDLAEFAGTEPVGERRDRQPDGQGRIADRLEQRHLFGCQPRPLANARRRAARLPARSCRWPARPCPRPRCTTPAAPRSGPGFPGLPGLASRWRTAWCGARCASTVGRGRRAGRASAIRRARSQLARAASMSRLADHAAARMCQPYAACSSPAASRCSAISAAFSSTEPGHALGSRRPGAGAIRRDRISAAIRRPPRGSAGGGRRTRRSGEPHLIDQLRAQQLVERRIDRPARPAGPRRSGRRSPTPRSTSAWPGCSAGRCAPRWPPAPWRARSTSATSA